MTYKTLAASILAIIIAGCGQSGPLYIPGDPSRIEPPPAAEEDGEEESEQSGDADKE